MTASASASDAIISANLFTLRLKWSVLLSSKITPMLIHEVGGDTGPSHTFSPSVQLCNLLLVAALPCCLVIKMKNDLFPLKCTAHVANVWITGFRTDGNAMSVNQHFMCWTRRVEVTQESAPHVVSAIWSR